MPETLAPHSRRPSLYMKIAAALVLLLIWTVMANSWTDKGCSLPQGYSFVITHGGTPDRDQGCEDEPGGPEYTDTYYG